MQAMVILTYQRGVGLIELLVSMFIGLFIMAGVVQMVGTTSQNAVSTSGIARIQENARYGFTRIEEDLMRTGSSGCINTSLGHQMALHLHNKAPRDLPANSRKIVDSLLDSPDDTKINELYDFHNIIGGKDGASGAPDSFIVRLTDQASRARVDTFANGVGRLTVSAAASTLDIKEPRVVVVGSCERSVALIANATSSAEVTWDTSTEVDGQKNTSVSLGIADSPSVDSQASALYLYAGATGAYRYEIDTSAYGKSAVGNGACDNTSDTWQYCALFRVVNGTPEEVVDGVHDMQVTYGYYQGGNLSFASATDIGDDDDIWNAVDRVKIELSLNSVEPVVTKGSAGGEVLPRTYTRTISLFNQI